MLLDKRNALYVKACVIANGITDSQGDTLYTEDIKKIFTSFNNQDNFEIYHDDIPIKEVSLLENYISTADETIGTAIVPTGSWMATIRVDNPDIKDGLLTGEFGGISLSNKIAPRCRGKLKGTVRYKDVPDAECVIPLLISFVEGGANGYGLHVMDYDAYIKKSKDVIVDVENKGGKRMDFKEFLNGLKSLIKEAEDTPEEEPVIEKEDEETKEEEAVETPATEEEKEAEEETDEEEPVVKKEDKTAEEDDEEEVEETEDEAEIVKDDEATEDDFEAKVTAIIEKVLAEKFPEETKEETDDESEEEAEEVEDEDTPKITKSEKVVIEDNASPSHTNYYTVTGRDPLTGKKIRN